MSHENDDAHSEDAHLPEMRDDLGTTQACQREMPALLFPAPGPHTSPPTLTEREAMTVIATRKTTTTIVRPLKVLVPLIQRELEAGTRAGLEHYRQAGEMLLEAKAQMPYGNWGKWLAKNFELSHKTAGRYMRLAALVQRQPEVLTGSVQSYDAVLGDRNSDRVHAHKSWRPVHQAARELDAELFAQERQSQADEVKLHRDLATELVDLGYRALATRLHPDRGGSKDAMARLNRVRDELKHVAETRRFV